MRLQDISIDGSASLPFPADKNNDTGRTVRSNHVDVQELIVRFQANQEMDCLSLDGGDYALIAAVYHEVVDDPDFAPTPHILELIRTINAKIQLSV